MTKEITKTFRVYARVVKCPHVFMDGQKEGIVAFQDVSWTMLPDFFNTPTFAMSLDDIHQQLVKDVFETFTEEINNE